MSEQGNGKPLEIGTSVDRVTAEEALRILNWYFDERRTTVRYLIKQREQTESEESNHDKQGIIQQQNGSVGDAAGLF